MRRRNLQIFRCWRHGVHAATLATIFGLSKGYVHVILTECRAEYRRHAYDAVATREVDQALNELVAEGTVVIVDIDEDQDASRSCSEGCGNTSFKLTIASSK
jgi:hypothetical protein